MKLEALVVADHGRIENIVSPYISFLLYFVFCDLDPTVIAMDKLFLPPYFL